VVQVLREQGFASAAFPVLGACSKRLAPGRALAILRDALGFVSPPAAMREIRIILRRAMAVRRDGTGRSSGPWRRRHS
jgi:hypothetical protein